jgi:hypothetical protein
MLNRGPTLTGMLPNPSLLAAWDPDAWLSPPLIDPELVAMLILGVIMGCIAEGESEDPGDF